MPGHTRSDRITRDSTFNLGDGGAGTAAKLVILVSTAKRTMETLAALEPWDDTPLIEPADELYLASDTQLFMAIREIAETVRSVMIIGHNPGLHELAVALTDPGASAGPLIHTLNQGFPTMGLAEFSVVGPWSRLEAGSAWLRRFIAPKMLDRADAE